MGKMIACNNFGVDHELEALGDRSVEQKLSISCNWLRFNQLSCNQLLRYCKADFPGSPVVKNLPCNVGDTGLIPHPEDSTTLAQLSLCTTTTEPML